MVRASVAEMFKSVLSRCLALSVALLLLGASTAFGAATLSVDHRCYFSEGAQQQTITFKGEGFAPLTDVRITSGGLELVSVPASVALLVPSVAVKPRWR